jgi:3-methyladenine DNA glycosylase AlkD
MPEIKRLQYDDIIEQLKSQANPANVAGMARFGINPQNTLGVSMPVLRELAKQIKKDHALALKLWASGIHEARILATLVDDPAQVTEAQMESWVAQVDSWDVCDQLCMNLLALTRLAQAKAVQWSSRDEEWVKRAAFVIMARMTLKSSQASDKDLLAFLPIIKRESTDERNFVKKAVNWALRQIGKRNAKLNLEAIATARDMVKKDSRSARWIAADALKELESQAVKMRLAP